MADNLRFMVRDFNGNAYGPVYVETICQWIREGRLNAVSPAALEGADAWKPIAAYAQLQHMFSPHEVQSVLGLSGAAAPVAYNAYAPAGFVANYQSFAAVPRTNGLAIASLVCSCISPFFLLASVLGIIFGIIALSQIKGSNGAQTGRGLAIAGIIVGTSLIFLGIGFFAFLILVGTWK